MNKLSRVGNEASQTFAELESPARRLFVKGVAGLGAAIASSSVLSAGVPARVDSCLHDPPSNESPPAQSSWGPFKPSGSAGRYLQIEYSQ